MKAPITNHQSPENTQATIAKCVAQVANLLYRRLAVGAFGVWSLGFGAYLVLGAWILVLV